MKQDSLKIIATLLKTEEQSYKAKDGQQKSIRKAMIAFDDNGYAQSLELTVTGDQVWQDIQSISPNDTLATFVCNIGGRYHEPSDRYYASIRCWRVDDYAGQGQTPAASSAAPKPAAITSPVGSSDDDLPF